MLCADGPLFPVHLPCLCPSCLVMSGFILGEPHIVIPVWSGGAWHTMTHPITTPLSCLQWPGLPTSNRLQPSSVCMQSPQHA